MKNNSIVCLGEILWDRMPEGTFLGGAPFNVAYHLKKFGWNVEFISRVGKDELGAEALSRVTNLGLSGKHIQLDDTLPTGVVDVKFMENGIPEYIIKEPAAWDAIRLNDETEKIIRNATAIVFGTLAQRNPVSKKSIQLIRSARGLKILDLNLRPPFDHFETVRESLDIADFLKINHDELKRLQDWFAIPGTMEEAARKLAERFHLRMVCITCGGEGAYLLHDNKWLKSGSVTVRAIDTVGAGDAFLAVLITGMLTGLSMDKVLTYANRFGAYIATQKGGTPAYDIAGIEEINKLNLPQQNIEI